MSSKQSKPSRRRTDAKPALRKKPPPAHHPAARLEVVRTQVSSVMFHTSTIASAYPVITCVTTEAIHHLKAAEKCLRAAITAVQSPRRG